MNDVFKDGNLKMETPIIRLKKIDFNYAGGNPIFHRLDFKLHSNDRVGLMAPNGTGKTTLFHLIMGLVEPASGIIEIFGNPMKNAKDFEAVRRRIGLLFQDPDDQLFSPTVLEDVAFGPLNLGKSKTEALQIARETLSHLGLGGFENRMTFKLSGGEKRLVSLAAVLAMEPQVLLLDEPLNGLDVDTRSKIQKIISGLELSLVIISHDIDFLLSTTDQVYTIKDGKILFDDKLQVHVHRHAHPLGTDPHVHE